MRIFMSELKKIWNWRVLAIIGAMGLLVGVSIFREIIDEYVSLTTHGAYGSYQKEMFELYGESLEPEELAEYDIPGKKAAIIAELDEIIAKEPIFAENNIHNYAQFEKFEVIDEENLSDEEVKKLSATISEMRNKLDYRDRVDSLDEWYESPLMRLYSIVTLEQTYINYENYIYEYYDNDNITPIIARALEKLVKMRNANLIQYHLSEEFSAYASTVGIFTIIAIIIFIAPLMTTDRMWNINILQYSSRSGRNILKYQFAATIVSAAILSILIIVVSFVPFLQSGAIDYWNARIMGTFNNGVYLYNITFGQYVLILAGMILAFSVCTACFTFILARFSKNIVMMLIKAVPVGIALTGLLGISTYMALSDLNIIFNLVFRGRIHVPEIALCGFIAVLGLVMVIIILKREKRVDVV